MRAYRLILGSDSFMGRPMIIEAEGNQVLPGIFSQAASWNDVVHLEVVEGSALLAASGVTLEDLAVELADLGVSMAGGLLHSNANSTAYAAAIALVPPAEILQLQLRYEARLDREFNRILDQ